MSRQAPRDSPLCLAWSTRSRLHCAWVITEQSLPEHAQTHTHTHKHKCKHTHTQIYMADVNSTTVNSFHWCGVNSGMGYSSHTHTCTNTHKHTHSFLMLRGIDRPH